MKRCVVDFYRCPENLVDFGLSGTLSKQSGYFRMGSEMCYGAYCNGHPANSPTGKLLDALANITIDHGTVFLPFDPVQIADGLRGELYAVECHREMLSRSSTLAKTYYLVRPIMPVSVRKHLQRVHFRGWEKLPFPRWPVDCSVENIFSKLLLLALRAKGVERIPFIWFWPKGASSCAIMTHDVETAVGRDYCVTLMDINDFYGLKSSFQVIPEQRYEVPPAYLDLIRSRGFEVNIHDFNHDGHLFRDHAEFGARAKKINAYGRQYGAAGFRSAVLYRRQEWLTSLDFSYDMSVPNVAHLDPQRGGCCTVMPYFNGNLLELPVTMTQDYSLFYILREYSIDLWKQQAELILEKNGLMNFIVHPDYIIRTKERAAYESLLAYLVRLQNEANVWLAKPGEVNSWWRERAQMVLVEDGGEWRIEGTGKERARVAYASEEDGRLMFSIVEDDCATVTPTRALSGRSLPTP